MFKKFIFLLPIFFGIAHNGNIAAQTIHIITFCNTNDTDLRHATVKSQEFFTKTFVKELSEGGGLNTELYSYSGNNFTLGHLKMALSEVKRKVRPNDVVLFWFDGHGYNNGDGGEYPTVAFNDFPQNLNEAKKLEAIKDELKSFNPRLVLVFANACNLVAQTNGSIGRSGTTRRNTPMQSNRAKIRKLFVEARGELLLTSSQKGEASYTPSDDAAFFHTAFVSSFGMLVDPSTSLENTSWKRFTELIKQKTTDLAGKEKSSDSFTPLIQHPYGVPQIQYGEKPYEPEPEKPPRPRQRSYPTEWYSPIYLSAGAGLGEYPGVGALLSKQWGTENIGFGINGGFGTGILADSWWYTSGSLYGWKRYFVDVGALFSVSGLNNSFWTAGVGANLGFNDNWGLRVSGGIMQEVVTAEWVPRLGLGLFYRR